MRSSILLAPLLAVLTTACTPSVPPYGPYNISSYFSDCIGGGDGCFYSFNIIFTPWANSTHLEAAEPSFSTSCSGNDSQGGFVACTDAAVLSYVAYGSEDANDVLVVEHTWKTSAAQYTITGNITVPEFTGEGNPSFEIYAHQETIVS